MRVATESKETISYMYDELGWIVSRLINGAEMTQATTAWGG